ncbi:hypothetical protein BTO23_04775 [Aliivibrio sifiae]|uniref:Uncharacterized protein n=1 Tax=Aliivibrio sifiae TaxID=566293 RepID=A0A2S7XJ36_9GAMM|nr:hypothetical protein BTO23_04775 [Aliivibrio sifiae]GLR74505.1 hypothetical protein GCM10007855_13790 [Aliivibrio sifiae]
MPQLAFLFVIAEFVILILLTTNTWPHRISLFFLCCFSFWINKNVELTLWVYMLSAPIIFLFDFYLKKSNDELSFSFMLIIFIILFLYPVFLGV